MNSLMTSVFVLFFLTHAIVNSFKRSSSRRTVRCLRLFLVAISYRYTVLPQRIYIPTYQYTVNGITVI
jgi:hypothetical protein